MRVTRLGLPRWAIINYIYIYSVFSARGVIFQCVIAIPPYIREKGAYSTRRYWSRAAY